MAKPEWNLEKNMKHKNLDLTQSTYRPFPNSSLWGDISWKSLFLVSEETKSSRVSKRQKEEVKWPVCSNTKAMPYLHNVFLLLWCFKIPISCRSCFHIPLQRVRKLSKILNSPAIFTSRCRNDTMTFEHHVVPSKLRVLRNRNHNSIIYDLADFFLQFC